MKEYSSKAFTDMSIGIVIILITWFILSEYDFFETMIIFLEKHEEFELDELVLLFLLMGILSTVYTYRRVRESKQLNDKLKETISNLQETKEDLISVQKMATLGELVSSLTHEINTPIGISITSSSHLEFLIQELNKKFVDENMSKDEFIRFISDAKELSLILSLNLNNTKKLVQGFRNIAVDQAIEEKREFYLQSYIDEILLALKSEIRKKEITVTVVCPDSLQIITNELSENANVFEVYYQKDLIDKLNSNVNRLSFFLLIFCVLLFFIAFALINNTIRLSVYSKRFLIRTMRLVGATNSFIQKPFLSKGIYQGIYSSLFAIFMLIGAIQLAQGDTANMLNIDDLKIIGIVFLLILASGLVISIFSTFFAVRKFIKLNENELYN